MFFVNMNTGFNDKGQKITNRYLIIKHYMKGDFTLDLFVLIVIMIHIPLNMAYNR